MHWLVLITLGAAGMALAHFLSRAPELTRIRRVQLVCIPVVLIVGYSLLPTGGGRDLGDMARFTAYLIPAFLLALLLAPSIAFHCGNGLMNFLEAPDWTPLEEEIRLNPIRKLIDHGRHRDALHELEGLLAKHGLSYEALLLKTKLLFHFSSYCETTTTLLQMIRLSKTEEQQLAVMESLRLLEKEFACFAAPKGMEKSETVRVDHELILFEIDDKGLSKHRVIPPGDYEVEECIRDRTRWLKVKGSNWGNRLACWESARSPLGARSGWQVWLGKLVSGSRPARRAGPDRVKARELLRRGVLLTQEQRWQEAVTILRQAFEQDPVNHEIAYRLMEAVRCSGSSEQAGQLLEEIVKSGSWTEQELDLLQHGC
jgi:hypothetical protein